MKTFSTLVAGDKICVGYKGFIPSKADEFLGFTDWTERHSQVVVFKSWKELSAAKRVSTFAALEKLQDEREYGHSCYAIFQHNGYKFSAYLYKGYWAVGSSADRARLHPPLD